VRRCLRISARRPDDGEQIEGRQQPGGKEIRDQPFDRHGLVAAVDSAGRAGSTMPAASAEPYRRAAFARRRRALDDLVSIAMKARISPPGKATGLAPAASVPAWSPGCPVSCRRSCGASHPRLQSAAGDRVERQHAPARHRAAWAPCWN